MLIQINPASAYARLLCEDITKMKIILKLLKTIFLFIISISCFVFMPPSRSQTVTTTFTVSPHEEKTEEYTTEFSGIAKFLEWIGLGTLILTVWLWRKELGVTQVGPLSGSDIIKQQEAGTPAKPLDESGPPPSLDLSAVELEMVDAEAKQKLEHIMKMFQKAHSINIYHVARELGITTQIAKTYLFLLTKAGLLRADGFPKRTIYTPAHSLENRILDAVRKQLSNTHDVLSERRFIRVGKIYEVDALLESDAITFLVEAKVLRKPDILSHLDHWVMQLLNVAKEYPSQKVACILAVACLADADASDVRKQIASFTFDSGTLSVQVLVFSEKEL